MWNTLEAFYKSGEWIDFKACLVAERGPKCEICGKTIVNTRDIIGHHTIELTLENVNDRRVSLNPELVKVIDFDCHNKIHKRFGYSIKNNEKGIYLVYGAPLSGKTTFVKAHKGRNDIVVDMDRLFEAMTLLDTYDKPNTLSMNVIAVRNAIIDNIKTRYGGFYNAWIIGGYPLAHQRDHLIRTLGAKAIHIESTKEECLQRLVEANDYRKYKFNDWEQYIEKWFKDFTE